MSGLSRPNRRPDIPTAGAAGAALRKPRVLIAGEFSSGKTQLISGLLGETVLPSNVTSTALPPVWLIGGSGTRMAVQPDGNTRPVTEITEFDLEDTRYGVVAHSAPILDRVDNIDTPGNSDPNIPPEMWQQMVEYADVVIWCSNATQAWRQSEKAVWMEMPDRLLQSATLLITHADRMTDQRSADRVLRRVKREASRFFEHFLVASLISDQDIARLTKHVEEVSAALTTREGAENPVIDSAAKQAHLRSFTQTVTPRRLRSNKSTPRAERAARVAMTDDAPLLKAELEELNVELPALSLDNPLPLDETPVTVSEPEVPDELPALSIDVAALNAALDETPEPEPALRLESEMGRARLVWNSLGGGSEEDDAATLLARIERLIEILDQPSDTAADDTETLNTVDEAQPDQAPVRAYE